MQFKTSQQLFTRAQAVIPGGVNSPVRSFKSVGMNPLFIHHAKGSKIYDVDHNELIDYVGSWGPMILGHSDERVLDAVKSKISQGLSFGAPTQAEVEMAELVCEMVPSVEMLRLVNSGTEAALGAIRLARGYTGREKVIKFEGCYHGGADYLLIKAGSGATTLGIPDSAGVPESIAQTTLIAPFNDLEAVSSLFDEFNNQIAAVIIEPIAGNMGMIPPVSGFLQGLRALCDREGALLIFDEVMTGFRVARGGAQELFHVQPDLTMFGKVIGGGLPIGAYGGRKDIMSSVAPLGSVYQAGTLSGNPIAVAAGLKTLKLINNSDFHVDLSTISQQLVETLQKEAQHQDIPIQTYFAGGMFGFFFAESPVHCYQDIPQNHVTLFQKFFREMLKHHIYLPPSPFEACFTSISHTDEDLEKTAMAIEVSLETLVSQED